MNEKNRARPEVLAPAGSWETLKAAAAAGADAVYFGTHTLNARRNAGNFDDAELGAVVRYCHERGMRAYFALNTLILPTEMDAALSLAALACEAGADAMILQDIGLAARIRAAAPEMRLHASTQMSLHSPEGVRAAAQLGFRRVVLARELSRGEIARIAADSPCELEIFVHGALCMSVSGQCYMSAVLGRRSGNRGLCAQPCRLPFSVPGGTGRDLSLKDLSLVEELPALGALGVASFKIEGRMKRPEYVAAATSLCRRAADGEPVAPEELQDLQSVFSRSGFTKGYYEDRRGKPMFGTRQYEDVVAAQGVLKKFRALYEGPERPRAKVDFFTALHPGEPTVLRAADTDGFVAQAAGAVPEPARNRAADAAFVEQQLKKTGGTPFLPGKIEADVAPGLSISAAVLNRLRRDALDSLLGQRGAAQPVAFDEGRRPLFSTISSHLVENFTTGGGRPALRLQFRSLAQLPTEAVSKTAPSLVFLPLTQIRAAPDGVRTLMAKGLRLGAVLPRAVFAGEDSLSEDFAALRSLGVADVLCGNLGTLRAAREAGLTAHGDFGLNLTNPDAFSQALALGARSCVLSFEQTLREAERTAAPARERAGLLVYGRLPLMLTRNCPVRNGPGCAACTGGITDRTGERFPIVCGGGYSEVLNTRPLWLFDRRGEVEATGVGFTVLSFTVENAAEAAAVLEAYEADAPARAGSFTRGLYYRGVE